MYAVVVAILAAACSGGTGTASDGEAVTVVTGFYPLAEVATRVGGDRVSVTNLTPAGAEPHDIELSTREIDRLLDADLVLYLGGGFQPAIESAAGNGSGTILDLLAATGGSIEGDPHLWLDPSLMAEMTEHVRAALSRVDPGGAAAYATNATTYEAELSAIDSDFQAGLARCERTTFVTSHDAFGYLARRYDLTQEAIAGLSPESEPDPGRLARLADAVREQGITTIFYETLVSPRVAEALAREVGVGVDVLNPIEGLSRDEQEAGATYTSIMRENLAALQSALGCQ